MYFQDFAVDINKLSKTAQSVGIFQRVFSWRNQNKEMSLPPAARATYDRCVVSSLGSIIHYSDVIMGAMVSQITSLTIVYSSVYSDTDQRKHQSSVSLAFVRGIHRWPVNSPHNGPVTRKMFPYDDVIMAVSERKIVSNTSSNRNQNKNKQRVLMHGHQGWNVRHVLCHIYMIYVYIWVVYSFCLFCCLFIIVTTQFVALYKPCKPQPKFR